MSKPQLFITRRLPDAGLKILEQHFCVEVWPEYAPPPREVLHNRIRKADALVSLLSDKIDAEMIQAGTSLKIISQYAVGYDNIDIKEASSRGIYVTNTPDVLTDASADFSWALLMAVARRVVEADNYVRSGSWQVAWHPTMLTGKDVSGSTIGIIGTGRIGQAMARRAKGFSMRILYCSQTAKDDFAKETGAERVDLETLLRESDFVSLHVPLTEKTRNLINADKLQLMKPGAYLINNSRGPVVDEQALCEALQNKCLAGAGLDVFAREPISPDNPLLKLHNVVLAPHISSAGIATREKMAVMVAGNLSDFFAGRRPRNLVNPEVVNSAGCSNTGSPNNPA